MRCRRWKPSIRRRGVCGVPLGARRSAPSQEHTVQLPFEPIVACPWESHPSCDLWLTAYRQRLRRRDRPGTKSASSVYIPLGPAASMASGEVRVAWFGVSSSMVSVFIFGCGEACCFVNGHYIVRATIHSKWGLRHMQKPICCLYFHQQYLVLFTMVSRNNRRSFPIIKLLDAA